MHDDQQLFWQELTDIALGRYFLLIAWPRSSRARQCPAAPRRRMARG
jgi:hypothetical protein